MAARRIRAMAHRVQKGKAVCQQCGGVYVLLFPRVLQRCETGSGALFKQRDGRLNYPIRECVENQRAEAGYGVEALPAGAGCVSDVREAVQE